MSTMSATFTLTKIPIDNGVVRAADGGRGHSGMLDDISVSWCTEKAESYVHLRPPFIFILYEWFIT